MFTVGYMFVTGQSTNADKLQYIIQTMEQFGPDDLSIPWRFLLCTSNQMVYHLFLSQQNHPLPKIIFAMI
jgi:hypothetical protein